MYCVGETAREPWSDFSFSQPETRRCSLSLSLNGLGLCFKEGRSVFLGTTLLYRFLTKTKPLPPH